MCALTFEHRPAFKGLAEMPFLRRLVHSNELDLNNKARGPDHLIQLNLRCDQWLSKVKGSCDCVRCKWIVITLVHIEHLKMNPELLHNLLQRLTSWMGWRRLGRDSKSLGFEKSVLARTRMLRRARSLCVVTFIPFTTTSVGKTNCKLGGSNPIPEANIEPGP